MSSQLAPPVTIQTSPEEAPSIPPWFAEVILLAHFFTQHDYLAAISEQVRLARGRAGTYKERWQLAVVRAGETPPLPLRACPPELRPTA